MLQQLLLSLSGNYAKDNYRLSNISNLILFAKVLSIENSKSTPITSQDAFSYVFDRIPTN